MGGLAQQRLANWYCCSSHWYKERVRTLVATASSHCAAVDTAEAEGAAAARTSYACHWFNAQCALLVPELSYLGAVDVCNTAKARVVHLVWVKGRHIAVIEPQPAVAAAAAAVATATPPSKTATAAAAAAVCPLFDIAVVVPAVSCAAVHNDASQVVLVVALRPCCGISISSSSSMVTTTTATTTATTAVCAIEFTVSSAFLRF